MPGEGTPTPHPRLVPTPSANLHTGEKRGRLKMKKMATVTSRGDRREQLTTLAQHIAKRLDSCESDMIYAQLSRQYRDTLREIDALGIIEDDDEIGELINERKSDGKSGAVR